jgi:hypothetical protein
MTPPARTSVHQIIDGMRFGTKGTSGHHTDDGISKNVSHITTKGAT